MCFLSDWKTSEIGDGELFVKYPILLHGIWGHRLTIILLINALIGTWRNFGRFVCASRCDAEQRRHSSQNA